MHRKPVQFVVMVMTVVALLLAFASLILSDNQAVAVGGLSASNSEFAQESDNDHLQASSKTSVGSGIRHENQASSDNPSPVMFIENVGQWEKGARFQVWGGLDNAMWLAEDAIWITVMEPLEREQRSGVKGRRPDELRDHMTNDSPRNIVNIKLSFPNANPHPLIKPFDRLDTTISYFFGNDPDQWHPNVPVWGGVRYVDLWPGVDLEVGSEAGRLVQRFLVKQGADVSAVQILVNGTDRISVDDNLLHLATEMSRITLPLPKADFVYTVGTPAKYGQAELLEFYPVDVVSEMDPQSSTSPTDNPSDLLYSTFLGGGAGDSGYAIAVDEVGSAYVTGWTESNYFPTTPGAFDSSFNSGDDAFVAKLNPTGSGLVYATFLGGSGNDLGRAIAVDGAGSAYVTGKTYSSDLPATTGAFDTSFNGYADAFVAKLNPTGSALAYATFLGGSDYGYSNGIAVDGEGNAHVTGFTQSSDFPTTPGAFDTNHSGSNGAFVVKLNPTGSGLAYATFLGGSDGARGFAIAVDGTGSTLVTGDTGSSDFPTTPSAFDTSFNGYVDAFVAKLNPTGSALDYATFLGGSNYNHGYGIAVDGAGSAYVTGETSSSDFPTTPGAFDTSFNGGVDAYVVKVNPAGSGLFYATFLGGGTGDSAYAIAVDGDGSAYVSGRTYSSDFPTTPDAFDTSYGGGETDAFVARLNLGGSMLAYATFLGDSINESGNAIAVDRAGSTFVSGGTISSNFPTTPDAFDTSKNGGWDAFVTKLDVRKAVPQKQVLVLVHGWQGLSDNQIYCSDGITKYPQNQNFRINGEDDPDDMPDWLTQEGHEVWSAHLDSGPDHTASLSQNAICLRDQISQVSDRSPDGKVILIAHSMGGLVARAYIEDKNLYQKDVKTLITLGTPHLGAQSELWVLSTVLSPLLFTTMPALYCIDQPAVCEFTTGIYFFNWLHATRNKSVDYYLVSGDVDSSHANWKGKAFGALIPGADDCVVATDSGLGLSDVRQTVKTDEPHSEGLGDFSYFTPHPLESSSYAYSGCIQPVLQGDPDGCQSTLAALSTSGAEPSFTAVSPSISGTIASEQDVTHVVGLDGGGSALFTASWVTDTVAFTLTSPSGLIIDPTYASAHPEQVDYSHAEQGETPLGASYVISATEAGEWTLNLKAGFIPSGNTDYAVSVAMESPITLTVQTDRSWYSAGQTATISATLGGDVIATTIEADIQLPDETEVTVLLVDQGGGLYEGGYHIPAVPGYATLEIVAEGTDNSGYPFSRQAIDGFQIASEAATLGGTYADRAEDNDGDGRFEALEVDVGVTTHVSGTFSVAADLVTLTGGEEVAHAATSAQLDTGTHTVTLLFDGNAIRSKGLDGPYRVSSILLLDKSEATLPVEEATDVWTTAAYTAADFGTCFAPVITAYPIDGGQVATEPTPDCSGGTKFSFGTPITLTAEAEPDYYFDYWLGEVFSRTNPLTFNVYDDRELTAMFEPVSSLPTAIANNVDSIELTWTHLEPNVSYQVWRDTDPNFDPDNPGPNATQLPSADPPVSGDAVVYTDDTIDPSTNFYYIIRGVNSLDDITSVSNPVGVFYFNMEPGS